jgi:hypothetical protein
MSLYDTADRGEHKPPVRFGRGAERLGHAGQCQYHGRQQCRRHPSHVRKPRRHGRRAAFARPLRTPPDQPAACTSGVTRAARNRRLIGRLTAHPPANGVRRTDTEELGDLPLGGCGRAMAGPQLVVQNHRAPSERDGVGIASRHERSVLPEKCRRQRDCRAFMELQGPQRGFPSRVPRPPASDARRALPRPCCTARPTTGHRRVVAPGPYGPRQLRSTAGTMPNRPAHQGRSKGPLPPPQPTQVTS